MERFNRFLAWHLPHRLVLWCFVRVTAYATSGPWSGEEVTAVTAIDCLSRWGQGAEGRRAWWR